MSHSAIIAGDAPFETDCSHDKGRQSSQVTWEGRLLVMVVPLRKHINSTTKRMHIETMSAVSYPSCFPQHTETSFIHDLHLLCYLSVPVVVVPCGHPSQLVNCRLFKWHLTHTACAASNNHNGRPLHVDTNVRWCINIHQSQVTLCMSRANTKF